MTTFLKVVLASAVLFTSVSAQEHRNAAQQQPARAETQNDRGSRSENNRAYYDSKHRDWHQWNDGEDQAYRHYTDEHHQNNRDFSQASEREQQQYWNWRHKHPDQH